MSNNQIEIYDTTLRDGSQQPGISFSLHDKIVLMHRLDLLGVDYIEFGWPGTNTKDSQAFESVKAEMPKRAQIVAFGMTCSKNRKPEDDQQLAALLSADTRVIAIVGKSSGRQATKVLGISLEENLRLIEKSCRYLVSQGRIVFFDAEHFFDGFKQDGAYSLECLRAAVSGGASRVVLCDTNGGSMPMEVAVIVAATKVIPIPIGIHTHNDGEMAIANSLAAVEVGADQVQVTINGYGERCGNANLCSVVSALRLKMGLSCLSGENLSQLTELARFTAEIANLPLDSRQPYVGKKAFCHKAGLHVNALSKDPDSYQHIDPRVVGNISSVAVSELSGRSNVSVKATEFGLALTPDQVKRVLEEVENLESHGFQLEGADGSLKLIMLRQTDGYIKPFNLVSRDVSSRRVGNEDSVDSAIVKLMVGDDQVLYVADGDGPVNALDNALRKALLPYFPFLEAMKLVDYKVRVLDGKKGTAKAVRILIDFSDGKEEWTIVGCSTDSIEASLQALVDGFEYAILKAH